jgi:hypothetical protein
MIFKYFYYWTKIIIYYYNNLGKYQYLKSVKHFKMQLIVQIFQHLKP